MKLSECHMTFTEALESYLEARDEVQTAPFASRRRQDAVVQMGVAREHLNAMTNLAGVAAAVSELLDYTNTNFAGGTGNRMNVADALNQL